MLLREITVMDACSHPHLVRLYEVHSYHICYKCNRHQNIQVVEIPTRIHLVLQLAPGGELFTKLTEQGLFPQMEPSLGITFHVRKISGDTGPKYILASCFCSQLSP